MLLSLARLFILICSSALILSSCASINELITPSQNDEWSNLPKPYINGLKAAQKGKAKLAIKLFKQSTESYPDFSPAFTNLALQQLRKKDTQSAKKNFNLSIKLNADNPISFQHLGVIARINGDFSEANKMYTEALKLDDDYALAHLNFGILLDLYLYDLESALTHYQRYQNLMKTKDKKVAKWIIDLKRRIIKNKKS